MNNIHFIWLLTRDANYNEVEAMIVVAKTEVDAREIATNEIYESGYIDWTNKEINCRRLGISDTYIPEVIYVDFKAG